MKKNALVLFVASGLIFTVSPISLQKSAMSAQLIINSAAAAEYGSSVRHYRSQRKYKLRSGHHVGLYHPICNGPYIGGGINGGTYFGGPWIDRRCQ